MIRRLCRPTLYAPALRSGVRAPSYMLSKRFESTAAESSAPATPVDPRIASIVSEISKLTLLETAQLVSELKRELKIADVAMPAFSAPAAAAPAADAAPAEKEPVEEKMIFVVKLESFDPKSKPKIIKEVKTLLSVSLVEAKKIVESAPKVLKEGVPKEDAEKIKSTIEALGGKITLD